MTARIVVGIDPSLSNTGVAIIREGSDRPVFRGVKVAHIPGSDGPEYEADRIRLMGGRVYQWLREQLPEMSSPTVFRAEYDAWFIVEAPLPGGVGGKEDERSGVRWSLLLALQPLGRIGTINPQKVKSYWTGSAGTRKGEDSKTRMMAFTRRRYPRLGMTDHNANDAYAIAHAAAEARGFHLEPASPGVKHEALSGVAWPTPITPQKEHHE